MKVPFWSGAAGFENLQLPSPEGRFRGPTTPTTAELLKDQG
jgi:hypothetical protein